MALSLVALATSAGSPVATSATHFGSSVATDDATAHESSARDSPQDRDTKQPGGVAKKRLEYRWEEGRSYTYHFFSETKAGDNAEFRAGALNYAVSEAGPRHDVEDASKLTATAFVVHPDGYLVTCYHCVADGVVASCNRWKPGPKSILSPKITCIRVTLVSLATDR